jgi:hypothetical protein
MTSPERCSCGAREKNKCNKESTPIDGVRYGKMCVKELKEERGEQECWLKWIRVCCLH